VRRSRAGLRAASALTAAVAASSGKLHRKLQSFTGVAAKTSAVLKGNRMTAYLLLYIQYD